MLQKLLDEQMKKIDSIKETMIPEDQEEYEASRAAYEEEKRKAAAELEEEKGMGK